MSDRIYNGKYTKKMVEAYVCDECGRAHIAGLGAEHQASYCCATRATCGECGQEFGKHSYCRPCHQKKQAEKWEKKAPVESWEFPLCEWHSDEYFFGVEEIADYVDDKGVSVESLRLVTCSPNNPRHFEINEYCCDELAEDGEVPDHEDIDKRINAIISEIGCLSWSPDGGKVPTEEIVKLVEEYRS